MIIGTAGHVDHGKTSLVRALTGVDTDRLAEERARGISIELGFAYTRLDTDAEPIGFIDVPGHRKFVQTMIAGASGIDLGLLVVAADDGPMPQTREHLDILAWLGIPALIVALSKVDRVDDGRRLEATREVRTLIDDTRYAGATIVPVSVVAGVGMDALRDVLRAHGGIAATDRTGSGFRMAIDRVFVLQGIGLIVTGTCCSGRVAIDDGLTLLPSRLDVRIRGIHAQNAPVDVAHAGQRVALQLAGRGIEKSTVHRGDWIVAPTLAFEVDRVDAALLPLQRRGPAFLLPLQGGGREGDGFGTPPHFDSRQWRTVRFHAGVTAVNARAIALDEAESTIVQLAFEHPIHLIAGDRFVLRDASHNDAETGTIAGGIVLDVDVPPRGRRSDQRIGFLRTAARQDARATLVDALATSPAGVDLGRWNRLHATAFDAADVPARVVRTVDAGIRLFSPERWQAMQQRVLDVLAAEHRRAPDAVGPGRDRLRRMALPWLPTAAFSVLLDDLRASARIAQTAGWLHLPEHRIELSAADRARFDAARRLLEAPEAGNNPPRVRDIARTLGEDEAATRTLFVRLAVQGEVYKVAHDHYFLPATVRSLAREAAVLHETDGVARAASFRDRIGVGRKVAIQILEFFDRVGYTRRLGDEHRVIQPGLFDG